MAAVQEATDLIAQLGGLAILAGTLAAVAAIVYRWYVRQEVPRGLALLVGLSGVAVYLNTTTALGQVIGGSTEPTGTAVALFNIAAFLVGAGGALAGRQAGDWFGTDVVLDRGGTKVDRDVGRFVQSVGRVTAVELPEDIEDVVGYDPVPEETQAKLAGRTFLFPRRLTVDDLRERLVSRLKSDYGVGHVDVELADDGSVEYLALGSRAAGIGPTLPPATNAVAIRADPAFAASAGDLVQVWETDPMRRVLTAELRGVADDTVTIAIDAADTQKIDPRKKYRLVTLPIDDRPDREFASLLRAADETFSSVTVEAGSPLHGMPVGALDFAVVAVEPDGEAPATLPESSTVLAPGDVVYAIARPDALRRLETAARPLDPSLISSPADRRPHSSPSADQPAPDESAAGTGATAESEAVDASGGDDAPVYAASPDSDQQADVTTNGDGAAADASGDESVAADATGETATDHGGSDDRAATADDAGEEDATGGADAAGNEDATASDFDPPAATGTDDPETAGKADESSFQQLKEEFESGGADWAEDDATDDGAADAGEAAADDRTEPADAEPSEESDADDALDAAGDDLSFDESGDDDLDSLSFEDDEDEGLSLDDGGDDGGLSFDEEAEDGSLDDEDDEEEEDDDEDDGGGGGASSFQQLKEEFESGEADWEDDVSDSPGGDMRLDE